MGRGRGRCSIYKGTRRCNGYDLGFGELLHLFLMKAIWWGFFRFFLFSFLASQFSFFLPARVCYAVSRFCPL